MRVILATKNKSKIAQIGGIFVGTPFHVVGLDEVGVEGEASEDGDTLRANALIKARFAWEKTHDWSMADDTGLFIDALSGAPGLRAPPGAGQTESTEEILAFTLAAIAHVPLARRTATFRTVAALVSPDGNELFFSGSIPGILLMSPRTACQPNMPYSSLFIPEGSEKVWAEMDTKEENDISHRGKAFRQLRDFLLETYVP